MLPGWSPLEIAGLRAAVFDPSPDVPARFALLHLHPENGSLPTDEAVFTAALRKYGLPCVAPFGARAWWTDRVCREFDPALTAEQHLLRNVVPWLETRYTLRPRAVGVMGIGMGGQGAVRLGLKYPDRFPVVASLNGAFDYQERYGAGTPLDELYTSRERCRQDTASLHLNPHHQPPHLWFACDPASEWLRGNDRLHEKLVAYSVPHFADLDTSTNGDEPAYLDRMIEPMIAFVAQGLERESRRLM